MAKHWAAKMADSMIAKRDRVAKRERKRMTAGERIAALFEAYPTLDREQVQRAIARRIDAAIRKAAWEGFRTAYGDEWRLAAKYGPHPARRK